MKIPFYILISLTALLEGCENPICLSKEEQYATATDVIERQMQSVIDLKYRGGNNVQYNIEAIDYDCMKTEMTVQAKLVFNGQISGFQYWARGNFNAYLAANKYEFVQTSIDPKLKEALEIEDILTEKMSKMFENNSDKNPDSGSNLEIDSFSTPEVTPIPDSTNAEN